MMRAMVSLVVVSLMAFGLGPVAQEPSEEPLVLEARPAPRFVPSEPVPDLGGDDYRIGRQDLLEIEVFDLEQLSQTVRVSDDGSITVPLLGRLQVAGLTKTELEALITRLLAERYVQDPQVTVFVKEYESKKISVTGAVKRPGTFERLGAKPLLEMISLAGGLDEDFGESIIVWRRGAEGQTQRIEIDLRDLMYTADTSLNIALAPNDIVFVPAIEKMRVFVGGAVKTPNLYEVPTHEPVTVLKAITLAGGTTDRAAVKKIQILRTDESGQRVSLTVNLKRIRRGKDEDPILQRDDVLFVPEAFF